MHSVLRRVLLNGGLTAGVLALVGLLFAELAGVWLAGNVPRGADPAADAQVATALRARVPLMLALWGFLFVLIGEVVIWRVRGNRPPVPQPTTADETERKLNELLAQAEANARAQAAAAPTTDPGTPPPGSTDDPPHHT